MESDKVKGDEIYKKIARVMAELKPISKSKHNEQQEFNYRGIDDVMNGIQPLLIKHKVLIVPELIELTHSNQNARGGGGLLHSIVKMRFTFYATDGSSISAVVGGEGMDSGDKSLAKAQSIAYRVALCQVFFIPTGDVVIDPDKDSYVLAGTTAAKPNEQQGTHKQQHKISNWTAVKAAIVGTGYTIEKAIALAKEKFNIQRLNNLSPEQLGGLITVIKEKGSGTSEQSKD